MWAEGGTQRRHGSFEMKLMDQAWPVTPIQVSQGSLGAGLTALGGDTPIHGASPEGIFTGRLPEARVPMTSPPGREA